MNAAYDFFCNDTANRLRRGGRGNAQILRAGPQAGARAAGLGRTHARVAHGSQATQRVQSLRQLVACSELREQSATAQANATHQRQ